SESRERSNRAEGLVILSGGRTPDHPSGKLLLTPLCHLRLHRKPAPEGPGGAGKFSSGETTIAYSQHSLFWQHSTLCGWV
ncbi:hypothetical protein PFISCL1PPCAC_13649, partial [Pristionchus fissidentatus]